MNRLRAGFLALLASTLLATTAARAATIDVTTLLDPALPADDNLCSLREAVNASYRAGDLLAHTSTEARLKDYRDNLAAAMAVRLQFPGEYYERSAIASMLSEMDGELSTQTPTTVAETDVRDKLLLDVRLLADAIDDLDDEHVYLCDSGSTPTCSVYALSTPPYTPYTSPGFTSGVLPGVKQVHETILRVLEQAAVEIERLKARNVADGCIDGSAFDLVRLPEGVHVLSQGQLEITARIELVGAGDASIITGAGDRLLHVADHVVANISDLQLQGGGGVGFANGTFASSNDCSFIGNDNRCDGGAIYAGGLVTLENVLIANNHARDGGGIFVDLYGTLNAENVRFTGNTAAADGGAVAIVGTRATFTDVRFSPADLAAPAAPLTNPGNDATGYGGAIYFNPQGTPVENVVQYDAVPGNIALDRVLVFGNSAQAGSAIYVGPSSRPTGDPLLDYEQTVNASLSIVNSTFGQNTAVSGGTIAYVSDASQSGGAVMSINNITMLQNNGGTGTGGILSADPVPDLYPSFSPTVVMANSLVMDNNTAGAGDRDCDIVSPTPNLFNRNYYRDGSGCPGLRQEVNPVNTNYELDMFDPDVVAAGGEAIGYLVEPFDPVTQVYLPVYQLDPAAAVLLVNRGAGTQESYRCAEVDQRNLERLSFVDSDCDIGAVEYQVGRRADDRITIEVNEASCLVATDADTGLLQLLTDNDVGDSNYVQYSLEVLSVERSGARAVVASSDPAGYLLAYAARYPSLPLPPVVNITSCPGYDPADPFWTGAQETIHFTPSANFHGETNITYRLDWETASGTDSGTIGGIAHVTTESRGGFSSDSLDIIDVGAASPWFLLLSLLGLRGRRARPARVVAALSAVMAMLFVAGTASAVDNVIYVNATNNPATDDPLVLETAAGDRRCTLREALETARNDTANLTRGDCVDGNEGPDIVELVYNPAIHGPDPSVVTLTVTLADTLTAYGSVTIRCPADANPGLKCVIAGNDTFSLINSLGSIGIHGMELRGGNAGTGNGGAINSYGAVSIRKSLVTDNEARIGGGIFLRGLYGDLSISESTFDNNRSTGTNPGEGGGAVAMTAGSQHEIEISSSTFTGNTSVQQAAALNIKTTTTTVIANSTFSGNSSTMGSGAIDLSGASATAILRNVTVVNNVSGCDEVPDVTPLICDPPGVQFSALEVGTGPAQHRLYNSIVAANFDASLTQDFNCSDDAGIYLSSQFSLYGENPLAPTCPVGATDQVWLALKVFDSSAPATSFLGALGDNNFPVAQTHAPNIPVIEAEVALFGANIIVDAGYNLMPVATDNLVTPLDVSSPRCANVDQRGKPRASGGRCDIGAYEDDVVTATPDAGSNRGRRDRRAVIDILANDTTPAGQECVPNQVSQPGDPYPSSPTFNLQAPLPALLPDESAVWVYYEGPLAVPAGSKVLCALVTFKPLEGEAVFLPLIPMPTADRPDRKFVDDGDAWDDELNTKSTFVLAYRDCNERRLPSTLPCDTIVSTPFDLVDDWADALMSEVSARALTYFAGDIGGRMSSTTVQDNISVSILNVPPFVYPEVVYATPGDTVRVNVLANDIDYDAGIDPPPPNDPCSPTNPGCARFFDSTRMPPLTANGINLDSLKVTSCVEKEDIEDIDGDGDIVENYRRCGFGDVFVNNATGVITWIPRNAFNPFNETITYQVTDYAYPKSETRSATLMIIMDRPVSNGGAILGDDDLSDILGIDFLGATGNLFFAALGLAALRRRRR